MWGLALNPLKPCKPLSSDPAHIASDESGPRGAPIQRPERCASRAFSAPDVPAPGLGCLDRVRTNRALTHERRYRLEPHCNHHPGSLKHACINVARLERYWHVCVALSSSNSITPSEWTMYALPPPGYIPMNVGVLFLIAHHLKHKPVDKEKEPENVPSLIFDQGKPDPETDLPAIRRFGLGVDKIDLIGPNYGHEHYGASLGVRIKFKNQEDKPFQIKSSRIKAWDSNEVSVDLFSPYINCFDTAQVQARIKKDHPQNGTTGPTLKRYVVFLPSSLPPFVGLAFKQALADGRANALLIEADGTSTPVPEKFWRTEEGSRALDGNNIVNVRLDDRDAEGKIFVSAPEIEADREIILGLQARKTPEYLFSPYIRLAMQVSINLHLQNGRNQNGGREPVKEILFEIDRLWDQYMNFKLKDIPGAKRRVATIVRHPQDITGGRSTGKAVVEKPNVETTKRRRMARPPQPKR